MAQILPFKAVRPVPHKVHLVASRSMDGYSSANLKDKLEANPYTFLHVINPDFADGSRTRPGSKERLKKVKQKYLSFIKENILIHDELLGYYVYRQIKNGVEYLGIIACTSIDDYMNGVIKIHEQTITQREEKLKDYLEVCEFNAEPVLFCYNHDEAIDNELKKISALRPDYDFVTTDKVRHTLWVVNSKPNVEILQQRFSSLSSVYIADGHHRSASSALLGKIKRKKEKNYLGTEAYNYYLGVFFSDTQLKIFDYNRTVKDLNGLTVRELVQQLEEKFLVSKVNDPIISPQKKHQLSMYLANKWYLLEVKDGVYKTDDPVGSLDASILTEHVLGPLLNIHDLKTDKRVGFIPGIKGAHELKRQVDEGKAAISFGLYPVTMQHLQWIADTNNIMPPKSTWVEPKMRSGLVIYDFSNA
jgi:uncharacterized protein (DUF1015 family)